MTAHRILQFNAMSTAACAMAMIAERNILYPWFGLASPMLIDGVAVGFIVYAGVMLAASRRHPVERQALLPFAIADWGWVAATAVVLVLYWNQLTPAGRGLLIVVGLATDVFATLQFRVAQSPLRQPATTVDSAVVPAPTNP